MLLMLAFGLDDHVSGTSILLPVNRVQRQLEVWQEHVISI